MKSLRDSGKGQYDLPYYLYVRFQVERTIKPADNNNNNNEGKKKLSSKGSLIICRIKNKIKFHIFIKNIEQHVYKSIKIKLKKIIYITVEKKKAGIDQSNIFDVHLHISTSQ